MFEVIDDALSVQEVHGRSEPIPVQALRGSELSRFSWDTGDCDDFLERNDLNDGDDQDDVDVTHKQGGEEARNHNQSPYSSGDEVRLFLFVIGLLRLCWAFLWKMYFSVSLTALRSSQRDATP